MKGEDIFTFVLICAALIFGFWGGKIQGRENMQREAIEANVAEWTIDPKTGEKVFRWKGDKLP